MADFLAMFRPRRTRDRREWRWFYRDGEWIVIHGSPDEYYFHYSLLDTPHKAAISLWCLREKPWFSREEAVKYVAFLNGVNGWGYTVDSLLMEG